MSGGAALLLRGRSALSPDDAPLGLLVVAGRVHWVGAVDALPPVEHPRVFGSGEHVLAPGLVDLHVHGAAGHDFADGDAEGIEAICRAHARHGTTALCATVLASSPEQTLRAIEALCRASKEPAGGGARIAGVHLEGPFLNPARAGAQPVQHLRAPDLGLLEELLAAGQGNVRLMTLAPELPGALDLVERLVDAGVTVSMGHSTATHAQALAGLEAGCRLGTHAFNAMNGLHHREPGLLGALLTHDELGVEVIADGHHLSSPVLELLWRLKGDPRGASGGDKLALITDCTAAFAAPAGGARLGDQQVSVQDGAVRLEDGTLAGSALTMERAVAEFSRRTSASFAQALRAASHTPARLLAAPISAGALEVGAPADLLLYDSQLQLTEVFVAGQPQRTRERETAG